MHRTVEAIVGADGRVRLLEPVELDQPRRALLTILDEPAEDATNISSLLSEPALEDWNRPEEDGAWNHLQPAQ
jgi:hypothetical protein